MDGMDEAIDRSSRFSGDELRKTVAEGGHLLDLALKHSAPPPKDNSMSDGEFVSSMKAGVAPDQRALAIRALVLRKFGEINALARSGLDAIFMPKEDHDFVIALIARSRDAALDALLPKKEPDHGEAVQTE